MTGSRSSRRRDSGWACPWRKGLVVLLLAVVLLYGSGTGFDEPERALAEPEAASLEEITLIAEALAWLGTPYLPGGFSRSGADCSGFISSLLQSAFRNASVSSSLVPLHRCNIHIRAFSL